MIEIKAAEGGVIMCDNVYVFRNGKYFQIQEPIFLVRFFDKREYAEEFQSGKIRMGNAALYREMENESGDTIRGDAYEHKIPFYNGADFLDINDSDTDEPLYMTTAKNFICCFYSYKENNVAYIDSNAIVLKITDGLDKFDEKWKFAVVIDYNKFSRVFDNAVNSFDYKAHMSVRYFDFSNRDEANKYNLDIMKYYTTGAINKHTPPPLSFVKDVKYKYQQEYRYVVGHNYSLQELVDEDRGVIEKKFIYIEIGDISEFSAICSISGITGSKGLVWV